MTHAAQCVPPIAAFVAAAMHAGLGICWTSSATRHMHKPHNKHPTFLAFQGSGGEERWLRRRQLIATPPDFAKSWQVALYLPPNPFTFNNHAIPRR